MTIPRIAPTEIGIRKYRKVNRMHDRENIITHLQIINTWASFARERDLQFFHGKAFGRHSAVDG